MPRFPSIEWFGAIADAINADAEARKAAEGWTGSFGFVVDRNGGPFCVFIDAPIGGKLMAPQVMGSVELLEAKGVKYFARANETDWQNLISGDVHAIDAIVSKKLQVRGDLSPVIERLKYRGALERLLKFIRKPE